jgi:hypothetical protein
MSPLQSIEQDMTMALPADQAPRAPHLALRILLVLLSALLTCGALDAHFPRAFINYDFVKALSLFAMPVTAMKIPLMPLLTGVALLLAITGRVRSAIVALGAVMLVAWAIELPSVKIRGNPYAEGSTGLVLLAQVFLHPLIALAAIWLALRDRLLGLAFTFVALPTLGFWIIMGPFLIVMLIAGRAAP